MTRNATLLLTATLLATLVSAEAKAQLPPLNNLNRHARGALGQRRERVRPVTEFSKRFAFGRGLIRDQRTKSPGGGRLLPPPGLALHQAGNGWLSP